MITVGNPLRTMFHGHDYDAPMPIRQSNPGGLLGTVIVVGLAGVGAYALWKHYSSEKTTTPTGGLAADESLPAEMPPPWTQSDPTQAQMGTYRRFNWYINGTPGAAPGVYWKWNVVEIAGDRQYSGQAQDYANAKSTLVSWLTEFAG